MSGKTPTIGKAEDKFRNYVDSARHAVVTQHYRMMRQNQTLAHVEKMERKVHALPNGHFLRAPPGLTLSGGVAVARCARST